MTYYSNLSCVVCFGSLVRRIHMTYYSNLSCVVCFGLVKMFTYEGKVLTWSIGVAA